MEVLSFSLRVGVVFCYPLGASSFRYFEEHSFGEKVARSYCDLSIYLLARRRYMRFTGLTVAVSGSPTHLPLRLDTRQWRC